MTEAQIVQTLIPGHCLPSAQFPSQTTTERNSRFQNNYACELPDPYLEGSRRKVHVLVVDDEHVIADTLAIILNRAGFIAQPVYSAYAALEALASFRPDVLVSDVMMPGMSGIELAITIRAHLPHCKILLLSGQAGTSDLLQGARQQGHHFDLFSKPMHPLFLLNRLSV